jgi:YihY family inner membrane protein
MAANALLSFFPFLIVMVSLCRYVFHWPAAEQMIFLALGDYFPDQLGEFIQRNLRATVATRGPAQFVSVLLLMYAANGIFVPLEVALNRAWGIARNRNYFKNQFFSFCMVLCWGSLALASAAAGAFNQEWGTRLVGPESRWAALATLTGFKLVMFPLSIVLLFLIYWLLPNGKVPWRPVVPVAFAVGVSLEGLKYLNIFMWPWMREKLQAEYGPFVYSATIILWSYFAAMVVLAGAEWCGRSKRSRSDLEPAC